MSVEAITWALSLKVERSSAKFVLVAMANCTNSDMICWPSVKYLSEATCQDRKTVLENIKRLVALGYIEDTQQRKGSTRQVPVYRLLDPSKSAGNGTVKEARKRNSSENGTVPKTGLYSPENGLIQSRFSAETVPKTGHGTVNEPLEPSGNRQDAALAAPVAISIAMRKAGIQTQPADPRIIALAEQGVSIETVQAACEEAKRSRPTESIGLGYVTKILERWARDAAALNAQGASAPKAGGAWWATDASILAKGLEMDPPMAPHLGETMPQFKGRIQAAIDNGGKAPDQKPKPVVVITEKETRNYKPEGIPPLRLFQKPREQA